MGHGADPAPALPGGIPDGITVRKRGGQQFFDQDAHSRLGGLEPARSPDGPRVSNTAVDADSPSSAKAPD
ncbi:MAG TPA: hypothetical protein VFD30_07685 [Terriglobia bacterium]|nr:hypothetical protein [Terriglobia bacterium]